MIGSIAFGFKAPANDRVSFHYEQKMQQKDKQTNKQTNKQINKERFNT